MAQVALRKAIVPLAVRLAYSASTITTYYGLNAGLFFDNNSTDAMLPVSGNFSWPMGVGRFGSILAEPAGLASAVVDPTGSQVSQGFPSYIDGADWTVIGGVGAAGVFGALWKPHPKTVGSFSNNPLNSYTFTEGSNTSVLSGAYPANLNGSPVVGLTWTDTSFHYKFLTLGKTGASPLATDAGGNTETYGASGGINIRVSSPLADNSLFLPAYLATPAAVLTYLSNLVSTSANLITNVQFDDTTLQTPFAAGSYNLYSTDVGFLVSILTEGNGPTGNWSEVVIVDPFWQTYVLLDLQAIDNASQTMFGETSDAAWQVMIDSQGNFYMNAGGAADANILILDPPTKNVTQPGVNPTVLPCASWCNPLTFS